MDILWGTKAAASDAWAGAVVGVIIDSEARRATHVLVRLGWIIRRVIAVPIDGAGRSDANAVYFDMAFSEMRALPSDDASGLRLSRETRVAFHDRSGRRVLGVRMSDGDKRLTHLVLKGKITENRLLLALEDISGIEADFFATADEGLEPDDLPSYRMDDDIENDIWEALFASGDISPTDLQGVEIAVVDGQATLAGNVRERATAKDIGVILRNVEGVLSVEDAAASDREVELSLAAYLSREHRDIFDQLLVHCQMGRIEISGAIPTEASMHAILQQVRSTPGVRTVEENLVIANAAPGETEHEVSEARP